MTAGNLEVKISALGKFDSLSLYISCSVTLVDLAKTPGELLIDGSLILRVIFCLGLKNWGSNECLSLMC